MGVNLLDNKELGENQPLVFMTWGHKSVSKALSLFFIPLFFFENAVNWNFLSRLFFFFILKVPNHLVFWCAMNEFISYILSKISWIGNFSLPNNIWDLDTVCTSETQQDRTVLQMRQTRLLATKKPAPIL